MGFSNWLCTNNTKDMYVKIVHPGRYVELHDEPVMAAEIMLRNPKSIVAHPSIFKQPWAIVSPDTMLCLGQKFYVVPVSTIRKLQQFNSNPKDEEENESNKDNSPGKNLSKDSLLIPSGSKVEGINGDDSREVASSSSKIISSSKTNRHMRKRSKVLAKGSPKKFATMDNWQPSLESIIEEI